MAAELAEDGITANMVSPAGVDSEMLRTVVPPEAIDHIARTTPVPRLSTPDEVAASIAEYEAAGVDQLVFGLLSSTMDRDLAVETITLRESGYCLSPGPSGVLARIWEVRPPLLHQKPWGRGGTTSRVGEDVSALTPHRPGRAQLRHPVLRSYRFASVKCSGE